MPPIFHPPTFPHSTSRSVCSFPPQFFYVHKKTDANHDYDNAILYTGFSHFLFGFPQFPLNYRFHNHLSAYPNLSYTRFFLFVKVKTEQISFIQIVVIQIFGELLFPAPVVLIPAPDFQLHYIPFPQIIHDHVGSRCVSCLRFQIIVTRTEACCSHHIGTHCCLPILPQQTY